MAAGVPTRRSSVGVAEKTWLKAAPSVEPYHRNLGRARRDDWHRRPIIIDFGGRVGRHGHSAPTRVVAILGIAEEIYESKQVIAAATAVDTTNRRRRRRRRQAIGAREGRQETVPFKQNPRRCCSVVNFFRLLLKTSD